MVSENTYILTTLHFGVGSGDGFKEGESLKMSDSLQRSLGCPFVNILV